MKIKVEIDNVGQLGPLNSIIYAYLKEKPYSTSKDLQNALKIGERTVRERLDDLEYYNLVKRKWGIGKTGRKKLIGVEIL